MLRPLVGQRTRASIGLGRALSLSHDLAYVGAAVTWAFREMISFPGSNVPPVHGAMTTTCLAARPPDTTKVSIYSACDREVKSSRQAFRLWSMMVA